jgi:uncharacterized lipoprotein YddW (UPF0748 family)
MLGLVVLGSLTVCGELRVPPGRAGAQPTSSSSPPPRLQIEPGSPTSTVIGLWVTRWDFLTADEVRQVAVDAATLGVTDLFFQVRGQADAYYRSRLEPWGEELFRGQPREVTEPDFDPLAVAIEAAHRRGIRVHAWVNVMPLWKGTTPPRHWSHPLFTKPELRLRDRETGRPQPLDDHYIIVNPMKPESHGHITAVVRDLASRYAIDGLHLDYIRFIGNREAAQRYLDAEPEAVRRQITDLVRLIRAALHRERPGTPLTAAVWGDRQLGREKFMQDYTAWMREGLVEAVMPMIYTANAREYQQRLADVISVRGRAGVVAGVGVYKHQDPALTLTQLQLARQLGANGICLFAYSSLFESSNPGQDDSAATRALRQRMRDDLAAYLSRW